MPSGWRFGAVLLIVATTLVSSCATAGWTFTDARHQPASPDHEQRTTFSASVRFINETASINGSASNGTGTNGTGTNGTGTNGTGTNGTGTNGTGTNGTGTNGTGTNGTGTNGTGTNGTGTNGTGTNGTDSNRTVNVTSCHLVIEPQDGRSTAPLERLAMSRTSGENDFELSLGPWPPGTQLLYHYEANLTNGTVIRSSSLWVRTPDLLAIAWRYPLDNAMQRARELGRPLMVFVYSGYARSTTYIDENLSRPEIVSLSAGFVCSRVVDEENPDFRAGFDNRSGPNHTLVRLKLPAIIFLNATTGKELGRITGLADSQYISTVMRHVLGRGPMPAAAPEGWPPVLYEAAALAAALAAGPMAIFALLRRRGRNQ